VDEPVLVGQDATVEFEDNHHSQDARELAKSYLIGYISNQVTVNLQKLCCIINSMYTLITCNIKIPK